MITFKQFLVESAPSPRNMDGQFNVANVPFDNENGMGSAPISANIIYRGAVAWMKPSTFRKLALDAERGQDARTIEKKIKAGGAIAAPWLDIDIIGEPNNPEQVVVVGHEGRARSDAFVAINGDVPMPVQLQLIGIRARHLSPEFFKWIEEHGLQAQRSDRTGDRGVVKPNATMYYWQDQVIKT
jgi:hypothetical protein